MSLILTRLPDEPIIIVKPALPVEQHIEYVLSVDAQCARLVAEQGSPLFRIVDLRMGDLAYSDILLFLDIGKENRHGALSDPRIRTLLVGRHPLLRIAARKAQQDLDLVIPVFPSMGEALAHIRAGTEVRSGTGHFAI
jgi:hypothetical protein